jgi:DNA-binding CsgD family transcriptional regulator/tetratricopeptide (TPR) repeat protein
LESARCSIGRAGRAQDGRVQLLERAPVVAALRELRQRADRGHGRLVWLGGDAGVGKTSVVRALAAESPHPVLWGACDALSTPRPLGPLHDLADAGASRVAAARSAGASRHELFVGLLDELASPVLVVIEDAHWADDGTLDLLRFVGRRVERTRGVVVVTYRTDELDAGGGLRRVMGDLATAGGCVRLDVEPLTVDAVRQLAAGAPIEAVRLHAVTGGNPFYVTEVLAAPGWSVPPTVADAVVARIDRLPPAARAAVETVAVEPARMESWLAAELIDDRSGLGQATAAGVLVADGTEIRFRHELARLAVEQRLAPDRRIDLHRRALAALTVGGADPARLAHHAGQAGDPPATVHWAQAAAQRAEQAGALKQAIAQYERALRHVPPDRPEQRIELLEPYAEHLVSVDRSADSVTARREVLDQRVAQGDPAEVEVARSQYALALWQAGHGDEARRAGEEAIRALGSLTPSARQRAVVLVSQAGLVMLARQPDSAIWSAAAIEAAEQAGDDRSRCRALNYHGSVLVCVEDDPAGTDHLDRAGQIGLANGWHAVYASALLNAGAALGEVRQYARAVPYLQRCVAYAGERDIDISRRYCEAWLARIRLEQGYWSRAEALVTSELLRDDITPTSRIVALTALGRLKVRRGESGADELLEAAWALARRTGDLQRLWPVVAGRVEHAWLRGGVDDALAAELLDVLARAEGSGLRYAIGELGFWACVLGCRKGPLPERAAAAYALHVVGDHEAAGEAWTVIGCPYEAAWALADRGDEPSLRSALDTFVELGATPMAQRVRRALRALGATDVPRGPRPSTAGAPGGLTPREREVLELLAAGLTDREIGGRLFVSTKTASHHVSNVLRKLGARTRTEAAGVAARLAQDGQSSR